MKKKIIPILITIIVILFGVLAFILGANTNLKHSKKDSASIKTEKTQTQQSSQSAKESSSVSVTNDNLNASDLTPKQVAALIAYHGSTLNNNNWQAWSNYENAMDNGESSTNEIFILNECPVQISQTGTGTVYSYTDQGGILNFYTLSNDGNVVYIYACDSDGPDNDEIQQPIETTTLQDMVNQANSNSMSKEIMNVANSINIKDCE